MHRFIFVGDLHIRGNNPRNRIDSYKEALKEKLLEIFDIAKKNEVSAILIPGDVLDYHEIADGVKMEFADLFNQSPCDILTTIGNHDLPNNNLDTYDRSSLKTLQRLSDKLYVFKNDCYILDTIKISFMPYTSEVDIDGSGYVSSKINSNFTNIHIVHGMLMKDKPNFEPYTLIDDVMTEADVILSGHDHTGYGIVRRIDGKWFCNPGSLMRSSASINEMNRIPQIALITIDEQNIKKDNSHINIELVKLKCAKDGNLVLDRSKIETEQKRDFVMNQFCASIKTNIGNKKITDINQILKFISDQQNYNENIYKTTMDIINNID